MCAKETNPMTNLNESLKLGLRHAVILSVLSIIDEININIHFLEKVVEVRGIVP